MTARAERTVPCGGTVDDTLLAVTQFTKDVLRARLQVTVVANSSVLMAQLIGRAVEDAARGRAVSPYKLTWVTGASEAAGRSEGCAVSPHRGAPAQAPQ